MAKGKTPAAVRFQKALLKKNGTLDPKACWNFTNETCRGYGLFGDDDGNIVYAHRFAYEQEFGPIREGFIASHLCNNRACCNPQHIVAATPKQNTHFMYLSGRDRKPEDKKPAKVMSPEEKMSCVMLHLSGQSFYAIAKLHGRYHQHVKKVVQTYLSKHSDELIGTLEAAQKELFKEAA